MNVVHIATRELKYIFSTAVGWIVLASWLLMAGYFWASVVTHYAVQSADLLANPYAASQMNLTDYLLAPFFGNTSVVALLFLTPALAMRLFSEELKQRTMELLLTSPVRTWEVVLGKYLGAMAFVALMLLATFYMPASLYLLAEPDLGALAGGYLSLLLASGALMAMCMLFSAMTTNQLVAVVLGFSAALMFFVLSWADTAENQDSIFAILSLTNHISDLVRGVVRVSDLAYFGVFIGFFIFATHQRVDSYRWR